MKLLRLLEALELSRCSFSLYEGDAKYSQATVLY